MATEHTLLTDGDGNTILPFTDAEIVATQSGRSSLAKDLQTIESHMKGVTEGVVIVDHAKRSDRWNKSIRVDFVGDATGSLEFDGSGNVEVDLTTSTDHHHEMEQIEGLEMALSKKAPLQHSHEDYQDYNEIYIRSSTFDGSFKSGSQQRSFSLVAGAGIEFEVDETEQSVTFKADLENVVIQRAKTSDTLKNIKIDTEASRQTNERYVLTATYGEHSSVGCGFDFHLSGSRKVFDGRLGINSKLQLVYQQGEEAYKVFHEGNMGVNSGLNADLLDGRQGSEYALDGHEHEGYAPVLHEHSEIGTFETPLVLYSDTKEVQLLDREDGEHTLYHTGFKPSPADIGALSSDASCAELEVIEGYLAKGGNTDDVMVKQSDNATLWNGQAFWCGLESERPGVGIQFCFESEEE